MRFLKTKIFRAQEALKKRMLASSNNPSDIKSKDIDSIKIEEPVSCVQRIEHIPKQGPHKSQRRQRIMSPINSPKEDSSMKNIAVNYARAIASFAVSNLAVPYLQTRLENEKVTIPEFVEFINREKSKMGGICSFRARLLVEEGDDEKVALCKRVFQWIAEVFIKYFSVNWITHGRVSHKETYLKFRFKMLRRVRNPESFTYIKERKTTKKQI